MTESEPRVAEAYVSGEISGRISAGSHSLQIGSVHGGVVTVVTPEEQPKPQLVEPPLNLHPISPVEKLDREAETQAGLQTLRSRLPFEVRAEAGSGKTALLVDLVAQIPGEGFGDRVVYAPASRQPVADVLQFLFECFYRCNVPFKPTDAQMRRYLGTIEALVVLDDVQLTREEMSQLLLDAPRCVFAFGTQQRSLWEGHSLALRGLPADAAAALLERELGRPLGAHEEEAARALCDQFGGRPLNLLQAAADARMNDLSLAELNARMHAGTAPETAAERMMRLSEPERSVLGLLAAVGGGPLGIELVRSVAGNGNADAVLTRLQEMGRVHTDGASWSLAAPADAAIEEALETERWRERMVEGLVAWAGHHRQPEQVAEERNVIIALLEWAERRSRWEDVLRLTDAVEGPLALARTWGTWQTVLDAALSAARAIGDRPAEARALHQLGTRALCLDDLPEARRRLTDALRIRESLGDEPGASVTHHNIELLDLPPRRRTELPPPPDDADPSSRFWVRAGSGAVVLAILGWLAWWLWRLSL